MARVLALWLPDWPLIAAGVPAEEPAIVLAGGYVRVCSAAARDAGVRTGLRRREAEVRCPWIRLVDDDPDRDARAFAPVVDAAVALVPGTEVVRPGLLLADAGAAARALGGGARVAERLRDAVRATGVADTRAGIADTRAAAVLAARHAADAARHLGEVAIVPPGDAPAFLAPLPVDALAALVHDAPAEGDLDRLLDLLRRLGVRTLGRLAALPERRMLDRFGTLGAWAHHVARGAPDRPLVAVTLPEDLGVHTELDPAVAHAEAAAFVARGLADRLVERLTRLGLDCRVVRVTATTAHGEEHVRDWRLSDGTTTAALVDRVRWQLDGWLSGGADDARPTAGIDRLVLDPLELVRGGRQLSLTGDRTDTDRRVAQALARLQGLLGPDAILVATPAGGREPADWVVGVPWREPDTDAPDPPARRTARRTARSPGPPPWPGRLPAPAPATVPAGPATLEVVDRDGAPVGVSGRGEPTAAPARLLLDGGWRAVVAWAGPWPADERWWEERGRRRARFQLLCEDGDALLVSLERGYWRLEARYD
jgi:protein ImuB